MFGSLNLSAKLLRSPLLLQGWTDVPGLPCREAPKGGLLLLLVSVWVFVCAFVLLLVVVVV